MPIDPRMVKWDDEAPTKGKIDARMVAWEGEKSPAYKAGRGEESPVVRGLANVINGPTFGFGDEIIGAGQAVADMAFGAPGSFSDNYQKRRDYIRGVQDEYQQEFPIVSAATQMATSAPTMLANPAGAVARWVNPALVGQYTNWVNTARPWLPALAVRSANAGLQGVTYGAVNGLGNSQADDAAGMALDAGKGAAVGGALGTATPAVGAVAMGGYNQAATRLSQSSAANYAREKVAEALSRDARGTVFEAGASNAGSQAGARFRKLGPEARVVDAGGQNTRQLLDTTATLPGRTKNQVENAIHDRQATRGDRLTQAADEAMGVNGQRLNEGLRGWSESRRLLATPLYNQVYGMRVQPTPQLEVIVRAAEELGAHGQARKIAIANRQPYTLRSTQEQASAGSSLMNNPQTAGPQQWSMRDLDYLKQGLDDIVQANMDDAGRLNKVGFAVENLRKQLVRELDAATTGPNGVSPYRIARETYAGPSALMDAAKRGRTTFHQDEAAIRQAMEGLGGSEADAFRLGAFEALRGKLGKMAGQTEILNMWRDRATREKLQAVFGDERSFRQFAVTAAREARMRGLEQVGRGSQTAARQYGAGDLDVSPMVSFAKSAAEGSPTGLLNASVMAWNRVRTPEPVRDQIGSLLLSRDPTVMRDLEMLTPLLTADRNRRASTAGRFMGLLSE